MQPGILVSKAVVSLKWVKLYLLLRSILKQNLKKCHFKTVAGELAASGS